MPKIILVLSFFTLFIFSSCRKDTQNANENAFLVDERSDFIDENNSFDAVLPTEAVSFPVFTPSSTTGVVIARETFTFSYNEDHEQAEWVAYYLTRKDIQPKKYKRPYFNQDPLVKTKSADWKNYKNVIYNRGHLLPAADRRASFEDYQETFYTSNISPQLPEFNAGVWNDLEQKVRNWASKYDSLYVVTGGVLSDNLPHIGYEKVSVPNYFYKVVATKDASKMIAFLVPHQAQNKKQLKEFVVAVDSIEKLTGIDFFEQLPINFQAEKESQTNYNEW
ncbi:DNA/RNA non-specific endonuclease [Flavobacterium agricola]|uniref:DNA/RNA non-specific endonuclease n=1 Tax=Flavobacterium agricola TaxID=2870839 RepID=A0ABY6M0U3_9FLAO|nr:DNA/RNA non-specific endonuclease [Flavobacterium agricola]UYW01335.1 DNA/RNA non-specific endonuclease [Flavobacterium agricola]